MPTCTEFEPAKIQPLTDEERRIVELHLHRLEPRLRRALELRHGLGEFAEPKTYREIGERFLGVTRSRAQQICHRAWHCLRKCRQDHPYDDVAGDDLWEETLMVSVRQLNCLKNSGATTVQDVIDLYPYGLLKLKNFGRKSLREIEQELNALFSQSCFARTEGGKRYLEKRRSTNNAHVDLTLWLESKPSTILNQSADDLLREAESAIQEGLEPWTALAAVTLAVRALVRERTSTDHPAATLQPESKSVYSRSAP